MTPNRRIFLNIVATYGRSLHALAIALEAGPAKDVLDRRQVKMI